VQDAPDPAPVTGREGLLGLFMIQDRLSDVLGELSRTLVVAYQIPQRLGAAVRPAHRMLPVSGSIGLFNAAPAELDQVDLELAQLLADLTTASIVSAHRYPQASGLSAGAQQRLADAAVLEQAKGRLSVQLEVQPDHALAYLQRYVLASGGSLCEAAEHLTQPRREASGQARTTPVRQPPGNYP